MLSDDIVGCEVLSTVYDNFPAMQEKIRTSHKFVLATDFAYAADGLVDNIVELEKCVAFCRPPYNLCWFEVAQSDRPKFYAAPMTGGDINAPVQKVGFLLETLDKPSLWKAHMFWRFKPGTDPSGVGLSTTVLAGKFDLERGELEDVFYPAPADFGQKLVKDFLTRSPQSAALLVSTGVADWAAEPRFLIAMLGLLNARNVVEATRVENKKRGPSKSNRKFSYSILKIRPTHYSKEASSPKDSHDRIRAHFVRGHFKQRVSGLFWWGPHMRGDLGKGFVSKDYELHR